MIAIRQAATWLEKAERVAVATGAGVSAESGVPTFRDAGGLWRGRDPTSLATPAAFAANPAEVWQFYNWRRDLITRVAPNPAHHAIVDLAHWIPSLAVITQNVDRLHQRAGSVGVLELHGNLCEVRCTFCQTTFDRTGETLPDLPRCSRCGALLRPAVVWFGETLPPDAWTNAAAAVGEADVLLVVGTSSVVYPAAGLARLAHQCRRLVVEINVTPTAITDDVDLSLQGPAASILPELVSLVAEIRAETGRSVSL